MSFAIAKNILRRFSAWISTLSIVHEIWVSLVTPSTKSATSSPKIAVISSSVMTVSSTTSCRIPATRVSLSSSRSARMIATQSGWMIYGSPDLRLWSLCASYAIWYAFSIMLMSSDGWYLRMAAINSLYSTSGLVKSAGASISWSSFFILSKFPIYASWPFRR